MSDEVYDGWNPLEDHYYECLISRFGDIGFGLNPLLPEDDIPLKDICCDLPYSPGGKCYKENCQKAHPENKNKDFSSIGIRIPREGIFHGYNFYKNQHKMEQQNHLIYQAQVKHIKTPGNFFCRSAKTDEFSCIECSHECSIKDDDEYESYLGDKLERMMTKDLQAGYGHKFIANRGGGFAEKQVVGVKLVNSSGIKSFFRGIVLDCDLVLESWENIPKKMVTVFLIDTGEVIEDVPFLNICSLEDRWGTIAEPLAYKCSVSGVFPKGSFWSSEETNYFSSLVKDQDVILEVENTIKPSLDQLLLKKVYDVNLFVKDKKSKEYMSVAKLMIENGQGALQPGYTFH